MFLTVKIPRAKGLLNPERESLATDCGGPRQIFLKKNGLAKIARPLPGVLQKVVTCGATRSICLRQLLLPKSCLYFKPQELRFQMTSPHI